MNPLIFMLRREFRGACRLRGLQNKTMTNKHWMHSKISLKSCICSRPSILNLKKLREPPCLRLHRRFLRVSGKYLKYKTLLSKYRLFGGKSLLWRNLNLAKIFLNKSMHQRNLINLLKKQQWENLHYSWNPRN